jgi:ParB-like chromosome segregation protein Spo0J
MPSNTRTTAARLLGELLDDGSFTVDGLAVRLGIPRTVLEGFRRGRAPIPLDLQLQLAILAIQKAPDHARLGHKLHGQVSAALAFEAGSTTTHLNDPPVSRRT